ncbi:MAG: AAA family ATPase [Pseudomonadota bacterium]
MKDAMQMVREALGEDAIIVATREENGGSSVRVTAAIEKELDPSEQEEERTAALEAKEEWLYADDDDEETVLEEITEVMLRHAVSEDVLDQVVSCANLMSLNDARSTLMSTFDELYQFAPLPVEKAKKPFMMIGPAGAGKTLATAKMAARSVMASLEVAVITTDTMRAGGREQLQAFTDLMNIELLSADTPKALKEALIKSKRADQIIIDTASLNPFDTNQVKELAKMIGAADMNVLCVMPAAIHADEAGEIARITAMIGARYLLPTRVDSTRRLGALLTAAQQGGLTFADVSSTPKVADGLSALSAKKLTWLLMPKAENATMSKADLSTQQRMRKTG